MAYKLNLMHDPLQDLITELQAKQEQGILDLISRKESEQFFVDFKLTQWTDYAGKTALAPNDKKNLQKAISGFGNSEGGILIWGVDTVNTGNAQATIPIKNLANFNNLVNGLISRVTIPAHSKVYNLTIPHAQGKDEGYLITIIPKFDGLPIQVVEDYKFYLRAGDSFTPITHSILTGMFGRKPAPDIKSPFTVSKKEAYVEPDGTVRFKFGLLLHNGGKGIAETVFMNVYFYGISHNTEIAHELTDTRFQGMKVFGMGTNLISDTVKVAPEQNIQPCTITVRMKPPFTETLVFERLVGAEGQMPMKVIIENTVEELQKLYDNFIADNDFEITTAFLKSEK
jgi:hypothetical protein